MPRTQIRSSFCCKKEWLILHLFCGLLAALLFLNWPTTSKKVTPEDRQPELKIVRSTDCSIICFMVGNKKSLDNHDPSSLGPNKARKELLFVCSQY